MTSAASNGSTLNQSTLWLVAALLIMLAVVFVTWFLYRNRRRPAIARQASSSTGKVRKGAGEQGIAAKSSGIDSTTHQSSEASEDQQQALLQELLELDRAFEAGKMKKVEYQEKRSRVKVQLCRLMSEDSVNALDNAKKGARRGNKGAL